MTGQKETEPHIDEDLQRQLEYVNSNYHRRLQEARNAAAELSLVRDENGALTARLDEMARTLDDMTRQRDEALARDRESCRRADLLQGRLHGIGAQTLEAVQEAGVGDNGRRFRIASDRS